MTVASAVNSNDYVGTGLVSTYAYSFKIFAQTRLVVTVADTDGAETELTLTTDYTVTSVGETSGGNVVLVNASQAWLTGGFLKSGYAINIRRVRPLTQDTDIRNQGDYFPEAHEDEFDKQVMIDQQQQDELDRSMKIGTTQVGIDTEIPVASADAYLGWNADADALVNKTPTSVSDSGPTINSGDKAKIINVNNAETAYQLSTFKALLEAIVSGGLTFNTAVTLADTLAANAAVTMGSIFKFKKGTNTASVAAMTLPDDGNVFDITGTDAITSIIAKTAGTVVMLQFDAILTLTDGSNLKINGDFVTAAESTFIMYCDGTNWFELSRTPAIPSAERIFSEMMTVYNGAISAIPSGWVLCDGNNGTDDLTDRLLIHADADAAGTNNVDDTGGVSTHSLSEAELGVHGHTMSRGGGTGTDTTVARGSAENTTLETADSGSGTAHTNRDKFHAKAYIMKT